MHINVGVEHIDLRKVLNSVDNLKGITHSRAVKQGLARGAKILKERGQSRLLSALKGNSSGRLYRSMGAKAKKSKSGALAGFRKGKDGGNHAHLVDLGTSERRTKTGANRGRMPANYFWTRTKQVDSRSAANEVVVGLNQAIRELGK